MELNKEFFIDCCQGWQNTYRGRHGLVDFTKYDHYEFFKFGIDEGFYGLKKDQLDIFIQGTDEKREWKSNFKIGFKHLGKNKKIAIEQGFLEGYKAGRQFFLKLIQDSINKHNIQRILWSGHSRGGAIATIGARDTKWHFDNIWKRQAATILITGGSPRVYNFYGANEFNKSGVISYRLVYRNDIVTRVPHNISLFGAYKHIKKMVWLGKPFLLSPIGIPWDHYPEKYKKAMEDYDGTIN